MADVDLEAAAKAWGQMTPEVQDSAVQEACEAGVNELPTRKRPYFQRLYAHWRRHSNLWHVQEFVEGGCTGGQALSSEKF